MSSASSSGASSGSERIAWRARRSPTKRGSRRFAAPGMIPSLRAGSVQRQGWSAKMWWVGGNRREGALAAAGLLGDDVVGRQQQLAGAADRVRLRRADPQLLHPRLAQPAIDL